MPASTWTPTALASERRPWQRSGWRAVEAQHAVATMQLARGSLTDQAVLEDILDEAKPRLPPEAQGLHWLLATPFRYWPQPGGSRFRRRTDPGVFYGGEDRPTACAESGYWRLRFWLDSAGLRTRPTSVALTLFEFHAATAHALDLSMPPLVRDRADWTQRDDYTQTQALAERAREAEVELIRYESVRNPGGFCVALLTPGVFRNVTRAYRDNKQTWNLVIQPPDLVVWQREIVRESWTFRFEVP